MEKLRTFWYVVCSTKKIKKCVKNLFVSPLKECSNQSNKQCCIAVKKFWRIFKTPIKFNGFVFMIFGQIWHQFVFFLIKYFSLDYSCSRFDPNMFDGTRLGSIWWPVWELRGCSGPQIYSRHPRIKSPKLVLSQGCWA